MLHEQQPTVNRSSTSSNKRRQEFESNLERIQSMRIFSPFGSDLIKELSRLGYYEDLTPGIVLFREGDLATCWYILLSGAVNIILGPSTNVQDCAVPVQTLSAGSIFGESTSSLEPHSCTALIHTYTELLRVEQRDFGALWRRYSAQLHDVVILLSDKITETVSPNQLLKARSQMDQQHQVSVNRNKQNPSSDQQFVPSNRNRTRSVHEPTMTNHVSDQFDQQQKTEITQEHYHSDGETSIEQMKESEENREKPNNPSEPSKRQQHTVQIHQEQSVEDRFNSEKDNMQRPLSTSQIHHYQGHSDSESSLRRQRKSRQEHYYAKNDRYFSQQQLRPRVHSDGDRSVVFRGNRGNSLGRERFYSEKGVTPYSTPVEIGQNIYDTPPGISGNDDHQKYGTGTVQWIPETQGQKPAASMIELSNSVSPETKLMQAAFVLRSVMLLRSPNMIRDRKFHLSTFNRCMIGTEMVDWILHQRNAEELNGPTLSRMHAVGLWQALLEQGLLTHVTHEYSFLDKYLFYRWSEDDIDVDDFVHLPSPEQQYQAELELPNVFKFLTTVGPDALFRMVLQKPTYERNPEELELVYEELLHVKALSHLSTMVKRELAAVIVYEQHPHAGTVLFNQGDEGKSWYILLKGSVNVEIHGKGVVCTLHEGDDFGKLALVNDAPRAASITLREDNCQFLRVDKHDFNHILRDVEANTVRLKEHGQDVLVLEKIPVRRSAGPDEVQTVTGNHRYSVMAGKPEKMLEYLLETRIDSQSDDRVPDTFLEDFILTHIIFMASNVLSNSLKVYYQQGCSVRENFGSETSAASQQPPNEQILTCKRRVITFLRTWIATVGLSFFQDSVGTAFIEELYCAVLEDGRILIGLMSFVAQMESMMAMRERAMQMQTRRPVVILDCALYKAQGLTQSPVMPFDICLFRVYNSEHQYVTLKARVGMNAAKICQTAASRFSIGTGQGVELVEVTSSGKRIVYNSEEISVPTMLTLNGNLFICFKDQIDTLVPCVDQEGPVESVHSATLELLSNSEIAYQFALFHWQLLYNIHESELIIQMVGRDKFPGRIATNLDLLVRRFKEIQFWTTTEVLLCQQMSKRVNLIRKFIKVAVHSKSMNDLLSFFAIILGLSDVSVSRLQSTWEKLPGKIRRQFFEFQSLLNPSRNHRTYRVMVAELQPPVIPFIPLLLKDLRFADDGSKSYYDGLVNFEKMSTIAQTLRTFRHWKSKPFRVSEGRASIEAQQLIRNFKVIDDQRRLMQLSQLIQPSHKT